jgi:hypothetical protein
VITPPIKEGDERKINIRFRQKCLKGVLLEDLTVDGGIILKFIIKELNEMVWTGLFSFRIETIGGLL